MLDSSRRNLQVVVVKYFSSKKIDVTLFVFFLQTCISLYFRSYQLICDLLLKVKCLNARNHSFLVALHFLRNNLELFIPYLLFNAKTTRRELMFFIESHHSWKFLLN